MTQLNAFIARSFAPEDEERIRPVLEFLDTFRKAGFFWETAEPAEVESVSAKVRRMIDDKDVFIGFFTRRYPVYRFSSKIRGALQILFGDVEPQIWSAPAWVLQESGYALKGGKELILLREPEVEVFGLQGDLEYITFDPKNPAGVFSKLSGMINDLLGKAAGTEVRVVISERDVEAQVAIEPAAPEPEARVPKDQTEEPTIIERYIQMKDAAAKRDFDALGGAWKAGTDLIGQGEGKEIDLLDWDCLYHESRFEAGAADGLETLRRLRIENPERPEPMLAIARCLTGSKEFEESARIYRESATLLEGDAKARSLVNAAKAFREAKQYEEGKEAIDLAIPIATGDVRGEAVSVQYLLLKNLGHDYFAFATAESALHENPQLPLRFALALDYRRRDLNELALFHFRFLHDRNNADSSSLHNLALMYSDCKLPVVSVKHYKMAVSMGETLSAANLGFKYLDCGMAEEAKGIIEEAMKVENHEARVEKCLAEIIQRVEDEKEKENTLLETAEANRKFFVNMGGTLRATVPPVDGTWKFPFGETPLTVVSGRIKGKVEIRTEQSAFGILFARPGEPTIVKTERRTLDGKLTGAVCQFQLTTEHISGYAAPLVPLGSLLGPKSGFILFEPDGKSAAYVELSDHKFGKVEAITKVD